MGLKEILEVGFGIAGIASGYVGVAYLAGIWPFTRINEKDYHILQLFTGRKGRVLEGPGTRWFFQPIEKRARKKEGKKAIISAQHEPIEMDLKFRSEDGLEGTLKVQYLYSIPKKTNAYKYFWELDADEENIKEIFHGELLARIGNIKGTDIAKARYIDLVKNSLNHELDQNGNIKTELDEEGNRKEVGRDRGVLKLPYGVQTENIKILNVDFDEPSQAVLRILRRAEEIAKAKKIDSQGTYDSIEKYKETAQQIHAEGSSLQTGDIIRILMDYDNNIKVAESGGTINKFTLRP